MFTWKPIISRIMLPALLGVIGFFGAPAAIALAQTGPLEPDFPVCPANTVEVLQVEGELVRSTNLQDDYNFTVPDGYGPNGQLLIWQGEGHLWDHTCTAGTGNDPADPMCDQDQQNEIGLFSVNSELVGQFVDHTPDGDNNYFYEFDVDNLQPGSNALVAAHINQGSGAESVFYKGVVCASPTSVDAPDIAVEKTANPTSLPEPGGTVTFTVTITNTGDVDLTLTSLTDTIYGDLFDTANPDVSNNTCADLSGDNLASTASVTCTFQGEVTGNAGDSETDVVTVTGEDDEQNEVTDDDDATVTIFDVLPSIQVDKTVNPTSLPAPGGTVTFTVVITNTSDEPLTLISLVDTIYNNLFDAGNPDVSNNTCVALLGDVLASGASATCTFQGEVTGSAGDSETDVVTVTGQDDDENEVTDDDDATVTIVGLLPSILVDKSANPTLLPEPGGTVTFTIIITNNGGVNLTLTALDDTVYDDLFDAANPGISNNTCDDLSGDSLASGASTTCTFQAQVSGSAEDPPHVNVVTVTGRDDNENEVTDDDDATVTLFPQVTLASLGDYVWLDDDLDGIQEVGEAPVPGVEVRLFQDATLVATTTTNINGLYLFSGLTPGNYSVEFVRPSGYVFTLANQGGDDAADSDPPASLLRLSATAARNTVTAGDRLTYTIVYSNSGSLDATGVTINATVPQTTSFNAALNPGWTCEGGAVTPGTLCSIPVGDVAVGAQGSVQFIVVVAPEIAGPSTLVFETSIRDTADAARTAPVTLGADEVNLTLDAGLVPESGVTRVETRTGLILPPTGSDPTDEPDAPACGLQPCLFLPLTNVE